jgi:hypothetical protein
MAIVRQQKRFGIAPIGVTRVPVAGQEIGQAVKESAAKMRARAFEFEKNKAIESGELQAAELGINEILSFDPDTKKPIASQQADHMGEFRKNAFERVLLQRFQTSVSDQISAKANEIAQKVSVEDNAPELFEQTLNAYLEGIGQDASGYYKQVIVDAGASARTRGESQLEVLQIQKMQEETRLAYSRLLNDFYESAYNSGASGDGDFHEFYQTQTAVGTQFEDFKTLGIATNNKSIEEFKAAKTAFLKGRISTILKQPEVAEFSGMIQTYLQVGGSKAIMDILPQKAQHALKQVMLLSDDFTQADFVSLSADLNTEFSAASNVGAVFAEQRRIEQARIAEEQKAFVADLKQQVFDNTQIFEDTSAEAYIKGRNFTPIEVKSIMAQMDTLLDEAAYYQADIGAEAFGKLKTAVIKQKEQLAAGLMSQLLSLPRKPKKGPAKGGVSHTVLNKEQISFLIDGIKDPKVLFSILPKEHANLYFDLMMENPTPFKDFLTGRKKIATTVQQDRKAALSLAMDRLQTSTLQSIKLNTTSLSDAKAIAEKFKETFRSEKLIGTEYQSAWKEISNAITAKQNEDDLEGFKEFASGLVGRAGSGVKFKDVGKALVREGDAVGASIDVLTSQAQKIVDDYADSQLRKTLGGLSQNPSEKVESLQRLESFFLGDVTVELTQEEKLIADAVNKAQLNIKGTPVRFNNKQITSVLSGLASNESADIDSAQKARTKTELEAKIDAKTPFTSEQLKDPRGITNTAAEMLGLNPSDFPDLYTMSSEQISEIKGIGNFLTYSKGNPYFPNMLIVDSARSLLDGQLNDQQAENFAMHLREEFFFLQDGRLKVKPAYLGIDSDLSQEDIAKLKVFSMADLVSASYQGGVGRFINEVLIAQNLTKEQFKGMTNFEDATSLALAASIPSQLIPSITPVIEAAVIANQIGGNNWKKIVKGIYETGFVEDPNAYSIFTGGSEFSALHWTDYLSADDKPKFDRFIAQKLQNINILNIGQERLVKYYPNSKVTVTQMRHDPDIYPIQTTKDLFGNLTNHLAELDQVDRAFVGAHPSSDAANPIWMVFRMRQDGSVDEVVGSAFGLNDLKASFEAELTNLEQQFYGVEEQPEVYTESGAEETNLGQLEQQLITEFGEENYKNAVKSVGTANEQALISKLQDLSGVKTETKSLGDTLIDLVTEGDDNGLTYTQKNRLSQVKSRTLNWIRTQKKYDTGYGPKSNELAKDYITRVDAYRKLLGYKSVDEVPDFILDEIQKMLDGEK